MAEGIREGRSQRTVAVFSHGDPLRVIMAHYLGLDLSVFRRLACDNGSLTMFVFNKRGPRLQSLNWMPGSFKDNARASS